MLQLRATRPLFLGKVITLRQCTVRFFIIFQGKASQYATHDTKPLGFHSDGRLYKHVQPALHKTTIGFSNLDGE